MRTWAETLLNVMRSHAYHTHPDSDSGGITAHMPCRIRICNGVLLGFYSLKSFRQIANHYRDFGRALFFEEKGELIADPLRGAAASLYMHRADVSLRFTNSVHC